MIILYHGLSISATVSAEQVMTHMYSQWAYPHHTSEYVALV